MQISTTLFKMSHRRMNAILWRQYGMSYGLAAAAFVLAPAITALVTLDLRWAIVSLMVIFLLIPLISGLLYINYSLSLRMAFNVLPHTLELTSGGVLISIFRMTKNWDKEEPDGANNEEYKDSEKAEEDNAEKEKGKENEKENEKDEVAGNEIINNDVADNKIIDNDEAAADEEPQFLHSFEIKSAEIGKYLIGKDYVVIRLIPAPGFIYLPASAFSSISEMQNFLKRICYEEKI